jgi:SAM-dependent methyltransferase
MNDLPPPMVLYQIGTAHYLSQALYVAAKLGVADHLDEARTAEQLAEITRTHAPSLRRVLRLLVTADVFAEGEDGRFALTPIGEFLKTGRSRAAVLLFAGPMQWASWGDLLETVRTGDPAFARLSHSDPFEYFATHPEEAAIFDEAMSSFTSMTAVAVSASYEFSSARSILDVGGGNGALLSGILRAHPHLRGAVLDMPRVAASAAPRIAELDGRAEFIGGDFFESVPGGYDLYLMKHVIHDWNDERATAILKNVRRAMGERGKLLIVEGIYPARVDAAARGAAANDCNMLVATGGRQRSEKEFTELYAAAGLALSRIIPTPAMSSIIEGVPA